MENETPTEPFLPEYEPDVMLRLPVEPGQTPEQAVEDFIHTFINDPRAWMYLVKYGPREFSVDMDTIPVTVKEITE